MGERRELESLTKEIILGQRIKNPGCANQVAHGSRQSRGVDANGDKGRPDIDVLQEAVVSLEEESKKKKWNTKDQLREGDPLHQEGAHRGDWEPTELFAFYKHTSQSHNLDDISLGPQTALWGWKRGGPIGRSSSDRQQNFEKF